MYFRFIYELDISRYLLENMSLANSVIAVDL